MVTLLCLRILPRTLSAMIYSFDESIVVELKFGRKKIFFTVLYRTPAFNHTSPEFQAFLTNFENLYSNIKTENPFAVFVIGNFNALAVLVARWRHNSCRH